MDACPIQGCSHFVDPKSELGLCTECDRIGRVVKHGVIQTLLEYGILKRGPAPDKKAPAGTTILVPKPGHERAAIAEEARRAGLDEQQLAKGGRS